jgi:hypothetical protein
VPSPVSDIAGSERKRAAATPGVTRRTLGLSSEPNQVAASGIRRRSLPILLRAMRVLLLSPHSVASCGSLRPADHLADVDEVELPALASVGRVDADPTFIATDARMGVHAPFAGVFAG